MTLKDQIESDVSSGGVFFNTSDFSETATYYPKGGAARSVLVIVDNQASFPEQNSGLASQQILDVMVSKSATSGIPSPQLKDGLRLSSDTQGEGWSYQETIEGDEHAHVLRFVRVKLEHIGGTRQQR